MGLEPDDFSSIPAKFCFVKHKYFWELIFVAPDSIMLGLWETKWAAFLKAF